MFAGEVDLKSWYKPNIDKKILKELSKRSDLKGIVDSKEKITHLDVREPGEYEICSLNNSRLIPLGDLTSRVHELDTADDIIVYCHHGMRSLQATRILKGMGYAKVRNLAGGIDAWAAKFDEKMPRY